MLDRTILESTGTLAAPSRDAIIHRLALCQSSLAPSPTPSFSSSRPSESTPLYEINSHTCSSDSFDIQNFVKKTYDVAIVNCSRICASTVFYQMEETRQLELPDEKKIHRFMKTIFDRLQLSTECAIIALIYMERLIEDSGGLVFGARNWRTILMTALLTASKVWDDLSSWNVEFAEVFPVFSLQNINALEVQFLDGLKYNLFISGSLYARYYFALRDLSDLDAGQSVARFHDGVHQEREHTTPSR